MEGFQMNSNFLRRSCGLLFALLLITAAAQADSVGSGTLKINGTAYLTSTSMDFGLNSIPPPGDQKTAIGIGNTGAFAGLSSGQTATILNISSLSSPATTNWIQLPDGINLNITGVDAGYGTAAGCSSNAIGSQCTPAGSPYTFVQNPGSEVSLTFDIVGNAYTGSLAGGSSPFLAAFSTQFTNATITSLVSSLDSGGLLTSYSATITTTESVSAVPEPGTFLSSMTGLLLIGWRVAQRRRWIDEK
jgi:hypothetical protein